MWYIIRGKTYDIVLLLLNLLYNIMKDVNPETHIHDCVSANVFAFCLGLQYYYELQ